MKHGHSGPCHQYPYRTAVVSILINTTMCTGLHFRNDVTLFIFYIKSLWEETKREVGQWEAKHPP